MLVCMLCRVLPLGHHNRWSDLPRQTLAPWVLPVHQLQKAAVGSALHLQGKLSLLPWMLQQPLCKEVRGLHQAYHQWVTGCVHVFIHTDTAHAVLLIIFKAFICIRVGIDRLTGWSTDLHVMENTWIFVQCAQVWQGPSTSLTRSASGTVSVLPARSAPYHWWDVASSPSVTTSCVPTVAERNDPSLKRAVQKVHVQIQML